MDSLIYLAFATLFMSGCSANSEPEVSLDHGGSVLGTSMQSLDDREFYAFRGIPYAQPPIGELRFKAPEPAEPWEGVWDATREAFPCAQVPLMGTGSFFGSEDCLYLNIYTPKLPQIDDEDDEPLPVIFWIHGGAFYAGDGGIEENGPEFLMDQDIVLVTINYRLGAFGFLSSGDQKIPGNFGMKDQVMALKWVQNNIENFGGDKNKVVLWGYSAGAACVQAHLFSPMSTGLFSGAIYQSGSLYSECGLRTRPAAVLQVLGSIVNCNQMDVADQRECFRELPSNVLAEAINTFPSWGVKIPHVFNIVQEFPSYSDGTWSETPFLTENPNEMLAEGRIVNDVPTIAGIVQDEGIPLGYALRENPDLYKQASRNFKDVARLSSCLYSLTPKKFAKIKKFYFGEERIDEKQFENFIKFHSDALFNWGQVDTALKQANAAVSPVYFYLFRFSGRISEAMAFGLTPIEGVGHADDLAYMFRRKVPFPDGKPNELERKTIKRMGSILENFARTGDPTPETNELFEIEWAPLEDENFKYLEINADLEMHDGFPFAERMHFWQQLVKKKKKTKDEL